MTDEARNPTDEVRNAADEVRSPTDEARNPADEVRFTAGTPETHAPYVAASDRYTHLGYRRVGTSGLLLPPISLGLWYNFGDNRPFDTQREILRHAFDRGVTHFDLANNYGPPYGSAEENFGRMMRGDFRPYRNELIISSKAGWDQWPGPYGDFGSRKYLLASLDESLARMSLDHVDIFYSHRADPNTPLEETIGALDAAVRAGKARYAGVSSYSAERTRRAVEIARSLGTPLVIHQPAYSMLNRWVEDALLDTLRDTGLGSIAFTPLAQGLLTGKYLAAARERVAHAEHADPDREHASGSDEHAGPDREHAAPAGPVREQTTHEGPDREQAAHAGPDREHAAPAGPDREQTTHADPVHEQAAAHVERATKRPSLPDSMVNDDVLRRIHGLAAIAEQRGQSLAQLALAWVLRPGAATSALIGVSSVAQLDENLAALENLDFTDEELTRIDEFAADSGIDLWAESARA